MKIFTILKIAVILSILIVTGCAGSFHKTNEQIIRENERAKLCRQPQWAELNPTEWEEICQGGYATGAATKDLSAIAIAEIQADAAKHISDNEKDVLMNRDNQKSEIIEKIAPSILRAGWETSTQRVREVNEKAFDN